MMCSLNFDALSGVQTRYPVIGSRTSALSLSLTSPVFLVLGGDLFLIGCGVSLYMGVGYDEVFEFCGTRESEFSGANDYLSLALGKVPVDFTLSIRS